MLYNLKLTVKNLIILIYIDINRINLTKGRNGLIN
jgi:hypothetical protein